MRNKNNNDIRTPLENIKIGEREMHDGKLMMLVKSGNKKELLTIEKLFEIIFGSSTTRTIQ